MDSKTNGNINLDENEEPWPIPTPIETPASSAVCSPVHDADFKKSFNFARPYRAFAKRA